MYVNNLKSAYNGPDPYRVKEQLLQIQGLWNKYGPEEFMFRMCWILRKNPEEGEQEILPTESIFWNRRLVPFHYNRIQHDVESKLGLKNIFLKMRQGGYTTFMIGRRLFMPCILEPGSGGLLISQNSDYARAHFRILKRFHKLFGVVDPYNNSRNNFARELHQHLLHTVASNTRELIFDQLDSVIRCASAEVEEVGQGLTLQHVVCTETARWPGKPEATLANMKEAIPKDGTLDIESTANGQGNYFHEECMRARDVGKGYREFVYHFHEWPWHEEYFSAPGVNPDSLTKEEHKLIIYFQKKYGWQLSMEQVAWRRRKKEDLRAEFDEKYPEDDLTCFLLSGLQYFDKEILRARWLELQTYEPLEEHPHLIVYKREKKHRNYIIGADVASGLMIGNNKLDWSVAQVIDEETGEQCATFRDQLLPEEFGWILAELGHRYNDALVAVERNEDGGTVLVTLQVACMYGNVYKHRDWWKRDWKRRQKPGQTYDPQGGGGGVTREIEGFPTNLKTRPLALNRSRYYISESPDKIYGINLITEALNFVRNPDKKGRPEASPGAHDDEVMAYSIAHYVRAVRLGYLPSEMSPPKEKYGDVPTEWQVE